MSDSHVKLLQSGFVHRALKVAFETMDPQNRCTVRTAQEVLTYLTTWATWTDVDGEKLLVVDSTNDQIAQGTSLSTRQVQRALTLVEQSGLAVVLTVGGRSRGCRRALLLDDETLAERGDAKGDARPLKGDAMYDAMYDAILAIKHDVDVIKHDVASWKAESTTHCHDADGLKHDAMRHPLPLLPNEKPLEGDADATHVAPKGDTTHDAYNWGWADPTQHEINARGLALLRGRHEHRPEICPRCDGTGHTTDDTGQAHPCTCDSRPFTQPAPDDELEPERFDQYDPIEP